MIVFLFSTTTGLEIGIYSLTCNIEIHSMMNTGIHSYEQKRNFIVYTLMALGEFSKYLKSSLEILLLSKQVKMHEH